MIALAPGLRRLGAALLGAAVLPACSVDPYALPLPGGADLGAHPKTVTVQFRDAMDLVRQGTVRVDDVNVGRVESVELATSPQDGWYANVKVKIRGDVDLPDNATASIRQTSLLGEKFVSLQPPESGAEGRLGDGDVIPLVRTGRNRDIEEVLGAASLLFNGGGLDKANTIVKELNRTLDGNEPQLKALLRNADHFLGQLDAHKTEIIATLEQVNRVTSQINADRGAIDSALANLPGALRVLEGQRSDLVAMLKALDKLGAHATGVVKAMKADTIANLRALEPILHFLALAADDLSGHISTALTFPFPDSIVGGDAAHASAPCNNSDVAHSSVACWGDWYNLDVSLTVGQDQLCTIFGLAALCPQGVAPAPAAAPASSAKRGASSQPSLGQLLQGLVPTTSGATSGATPAPATGGLICRLLNSCRPAAASHGDFADLLYGPEVTR